MTSDDTMHDTDEGRNEISVHYEHPDTTYREAELRSSSSTVPGGPTRDSISVVDHGRQDTPEDRRNARCVRHPVAPSRQVLRDPVWQSDCDFRTVIVLHNEEDTHQVASAPSPMQISAVCTLGLRFMARWISSPVIP